MICTFSFLSLLFYFIIIFSAVSVPQNEDEFDREDTKSEITILTDDVCTVMPSNDATESPYEQSIFENTPSTGSCLGKDTEMNENTQESLVIQNNDVPETPSITDTGSDISILHHLPSNNAPPLFPPSTSEDILSSLPAVALSELQKPDDGLFPRKRKMEQHRVLSSGAVAVKQQRVLRYGIVADHKR